MAALAADPDLERVVAVAIAQAGQTVGLGLGRDVAAHAGRVDPQGPRRAAEQLAHALALELAAQVPERGIEPGKRAAEIGARELVLAIGDQVDEALDVERAPAERVRRDLAVDDLAR